ncbi:MAG: efflux RND transporter periplasmic adaptor subunit [Phycisphaerae bacterium]|nr:efflux RND transporter periplasmic adaptor subunit [Phycisphaerae bacterium]
MKKMILLVAAVLIVIVLVYANHRLQGSPRKLNWSFAPPAALQVEAQKPTRRPITHVVTAPGTIQPVVEVEISSQVVGRVLKLPVKEGEAVKKGDLLAKLDAADYEARVRSAEARVQRLKAAIRQVSADLEKADRDDKRYKNLIASDAASIDERENVATILSRLQAARDMAQQESIEAQGALDAAQEDLRRTSIISPIDGVVAQILAEEGEVLIPGTMNLPGAVFMVISDMARMEVKTQIDESDVVRVRPGQRAWIYLTTDDRTAIPGVVQRVTPKGVKQVEVTTFETRILVESADPRVRSGMTASVEIEVRRHENALAVPIQAVRHRKRKDLPAEAVKEGATEVSTTSSAARPATVPAALGRTRRSREPEAEYLKVVFVIKDGKAQARLVQTDISDESHVEITSGLGSDDQVIIGPYRVLDVLKHGQAVEATGATATRPAGS